MDGRTFLLDLSLFFGLHAVVHDHIVIRSTLRDQPMQQQKNMDGVYDIRCSTA